MKKKQKGEILVKKIEVDELTNEPKIVEVSEKEYLDVPIEKADFIEMKTDKSIGKQMAMEKIIGYKKDDSIDKRQKLFKNLSMLLFGLFVVGSLIFTAYNDFLAPGKEFPKLWQLKDIFLSSWLFFLGAVLCLVFSFIFKGLKTSIMCKSMTGKWHLKTCIETGIIGTYYNNVTPLAVGGQPFEIYHLSKHGVHGGVASSIPIATFFLNQLAFVILGIVSLILFNRNTLGAPDWFMSAFSGVAPVYNVLAVVGLICCVFVPSLVILFSLLPRVGARLVHLVMKIGSKLRVIKNPKETTQKTIKTVVHNSHCLKKLAASPLVFSSTFILSFMENMANVSIAFFSLKAFGFDLGLHWILEWLIVSEICFILFASITFIPTPGNAGAADLSFYLLFETALMAGLAFPAMMVWRGISFYGVILLGFLFASHKKKSDARKAKKAEAVATADQGEEAAEDTAIGTDDTENNQ